MLRIIILIQVVTLVSTTNFVLSEVSSNITKFMESQTKLCSYISLCTSKNTSVFFKRYKQISIPCCHECFCDEECQARGDCCPDFNSFSHNRTSTNNDMELLPNITGSNKNPYTGTSCVRNHHGLFKNNEGYEMVASCPRIFTENATKIHCETTFDILNANIYDHIPVSDTASGLTFKNRFCKSCHFNNAGSFEFWEVWLACDGNFYFSYFNVTNPLDLVKKIFQSKTRMCSIVFKPIDTSPQQCVAIHEEVIDTCSDGSWDADLQNACKEYTWPIMTMDGLRLDSYKNYACMLCNGVKFIEKCWRIDFQSSKHFTALLDVETSDNQTSKTLLEYPSEQKDSYTTPQYQLIQRSFTSLDGNCSKGFVYDKRKSTCRQVLCPHFFYIKNGSCAPIFRVIKGVFYRVILEILLPYTLKGAQAELVEAAMFSSLDDIFFRRLGKGNYEFSLWRNPKSVKVITRTVAYALYLTVSWQFAKGNYFAVLEFVNQLVLFEREFSVSVLMKASSVNVTVGLEFGSYKNKPVKFRNLEQEYMYLVLPSVWKETFAQTSSLLDVTKVSLCHTVILSQFEFRKIDRSTLLIEVLEPKRILHNGLFSIMRMYGEYHACVCVNDVFSDVNESSSYVLNITDSVRLMYQWPAKTENKIKPEDDDTKSDTLNTNNSITDSKSVVAVVCSCALVIAIISIKTFLKRIKKRFPSSDDEISDDGFAGNIPMSNITQMSENIGGKQHGKAEIVNDESL